MVFWMATKAGLSLHQLKPQFVPHRFNAFGNGHQSISKASIREGNNVEIILNLKIISVWMPTIIDRHILNSKNTNWMDVRGYFGHDQTASFKASQMCTQLNQLMICFKFFYVLQIKKGAVVVAPNIVIGSLNDRPKAANGYQLMRIGFGTCAFKFFPIK